MNIISHSHNWKMKKGKIAVFIMTFSGDEKYLFQCLRYLRKQRTRYDLDFFIIDDANSPLENIPDGVHYWKSHFDRQGNLNGQECAHGMLIEMLKVARMSQAEYIMKVDCDMAVRSLFNFLEPLEENPLQVIGFKLNKRMCYCAGVTYILPTVGLYNAIRNFRVWYRDEAKNDAEGEFAPHCPEDWAITRCVADVNNFPLFQWDNSKENNPSNWLLSPFNFEEVTDNLEISPLSLARFQLYDFVNFGNRYLLKCENPRDFAAKCMKQFADFDLDTNNRNWL